MDLRILDGGVFLVAREERAVASPQLSLVPTPVVVEVVEVVERIGDAPARPALPSEADWTRWEAEAWRVAVQAVRRRA